MKSKKVISMVWLVFFMLGTTSLYSWAGEIDQNFTQNMDGGATYSNGIPGYINQSNEGLFMVLPSNKNKKSMNGALEIKEEKKRKFLQNVRHFIKDNASKGSFVKG